MPAGQSYGDISPVEGIFPGDSYLCRISNTNLYNLYSLFLKWINSSNCLGGYEYLSMQRFKDVNNSFSGMTHRLGTSIIWRVLFPRFCFL